MNNCISEIAKAIELNNESSTFDSNVEKLNKEYIALQNVAENRGYNKSVITAVFNYTMNHHLFELDNVDKTNTILNIITEMACPATIDDSRSTELLKHLQQQIQKRINEL